MSSDIPAYLRCAPAHPLEREVVHLVAKYLAAFKWPGDRFKVEIKFFFDLSKTGSAHVSVLNPKDGDLTGELRLGFNHWFLISNPKDMFRYVVPSEVARAHAQRVALEDGTVVGNYGPEWAVAYSSITTEGALDEVSRLARFDARPLRLRKRGVPVRCSCPGAASFNVFAGKAEKLDAGEALCPSCKAPFKQIQDAEIPRDIRSAVEYLQFAEERVRAANSR